MRVLTYLALFAGSVAAAQSTATVLNFYQFDSTLTLKGSDASATTYEKTCPTSAAGGSVGSSQLGSTITLSSSVPSTTPKARLRRQDASSIDADDDMYCTPYILTQGPSTWGFHFTDLTPGFWTLDMDCKWKGDMTAADITCDLTQDGAFATINSDIVSSAVLSAQEVQSLQVFQTITVVEATGASSSGTASNTATKSPTASRTSSSAGSTSQAVAQSTGLAPAGPLPTGAMVFVGGAAGVLAAALAL